MSDGEDAPPTKEDTRLVKVEQALSNRSTCKATGEKIDKGEWRVGMEAWVAGRMSMTWQVGQFAVCFSHMFPSNACAWHISWYLSGFFGQSSSRGPSQMFSSSFGLGNAEAGTVFEGLPRRICNGQGEFRHLQEVYP